MVVNVRKLGKLLNVVLGDVRQQLAWMFDLVDNCVVILPLRSWPDIISCCSL